MSLTLSHPITNPLYRMCIMFSPSCISPNLCDHVIRHLNIVRSKLYQSWIRIKDIARARNIMVYEYNVTMNTVKPTSLPPPPPFAHTNKMHRKSYIHKLWRLWKTNCKCVQCVKEHNFLILHIKYTFKKIAQ